VRVLEREIRILRGYILLPHLRNPGTHLFQFAPNPFSFVSFQLPFPRSPTSFHKIRALVIACNASIFCREIRESAKHENLLEIAQFCICTLVWDVSHVFNIFLTNATFNETFSPGSNSQELVDSKEMSQHPNSRWQERSFTRFIRKVECVIPLSKKLSNYRR